MATTKPTRKQPNNTFKVKVVDNTLIITMTDEGGYIININMIPIDAIVRASYNCIHGQLDLIINEVAGDISDHEVYMLDEEGNPIPIMNEPIAKTDVDNNPTGEFHPAEPSGKFYTRFAIKGQMAGFRVIIADQVAIRDLLKVFLNIKQDAAFDKAFEGFKAHEAAQKKMDEMKKKVEEEAAKQDKPGGKILDFQGNPIEPDKTD